MESVLEVAGVRANRVVYSDEENAAVAVGLRILWRLDCKLTRRETFLRPGSRARASPLKVERASFQAFPCPAASAVPRSAFHHEYTPEAATQ